MRLVASGGGSGGHVYPILSVLEAMSDPGDGRMEAMEVLYIGSKRGIEGTLAAERGLLFRSVAVAPFRDGGALQLIAGVGKIFLGTVQAGLKIKSFSPDVILSTGGYVSVPATVAAWVLGIPSLVYLPDVEPGWAVKFLARISRVVAVTSIRSKDSLEGANVVETGYPVRSDFFRIDKAAARERLSLEASDRVLLVLGGSQGSHSINRAIADHLPRLLESCVVLHVSGTQDEPWLEEVGRILPPHLQSRYRLYGYMHEEMPAAMIAADLAVSRAGASVMGELPAAGLAAILVPYPHAGGHQERNAAPLVDAGAAVVIAESDRGQLIPAVERILKDDATRLGMAERMKALARPDAALRIAGLLEGMAHKRVPQAVAALEPKGGHPREQS